MKRKELMLGNEAIARGLVESGCAVATAYPGTPSSEILPAVAELAKENPTPLHVQWAVNEKVAFEIAYAGAISGLRAAVCMKQVGLNVAADPLMSAAYMGTKGGFVVISADDPGPHSSQTEQDSRMMAMMAKIPVLDPNSPAQAKAMAGLAFELSEAFSIPVMLRPTTRICHARQDIELGELPKNLPTPDFQKEPSRWAATPKFRLRLHGELTEKLDQIAAYPKTAPILCNPGCNPKSNFGSNPKSNFGSDAGAANEGQHREKIAVVASGVAAAHAEEILKSSDLWNRLPLYQVIQPFPLHTTFAEDLLKNYEKILVIEETTGIIEMQLSDRNRVLGKRNHYVPEVGEILPETVERLVKEFAGESFSPIHVPQSPGRRPTLCAGCSHRAAFFAIKKAAPKGIYTSDIGCYTLGLNLGAVDTVLCMGAAISQAAGFYHTYKHEKKRPDIVATMGDSTFFHAGIPPLIDAAVQQAKFTLVILDNRTTAMTGHQPTPSTGSGACGEPLNRVDIEAIIKGCGIEYCRTASPYDLKSFLPLLKEAVKYSREKGPAVVIARHPCILDRTRTDLLQERYRMEVGDTCDGCGYCVQHFECPALILEKIEVDEVDKEDEEEKLVRIDQTLCCGCGVCVHVCPKGSFIAHPIEASPVEVKPEERGRK